VQAPVLFYFGATLLVAGSWFWCAIMIRMALNWQQDRAGRSLPLPMFAATANAILWLRPP